MKGLFLTGCVVVSICGAMAAPFSDLTFDAACKAAAVQRKIVLIDFYTTWCGPCKMLDRNTWTDPAVIKLLESKTIALRLDAEKETGLARRYHIDAYPSVLMLRPDGTEMDRLVGYRAPKAFIADFNDSLQGKDSVSRAKAALDAAGTTDPMARMQYGSALAQKGKNAEALAEYLWCFDHGLDKSPAFVGVRSSFLLSAIKGLGERYPAATEALVKRRDEREAKLTAGSADRQAALDLVALNKVLGQTDKNLVVFDKLPAGSQARVAVARLIVDQLLEARRYTDALLGMVDFEEQVARFKTMMATAKNDQMRDMLTQYVVTSGAHRFEALAGLKRNDQAKALAQQILEFDSSPGTREELAQAATRAGSSDLAAYAKQHRVGPEANTGG